MVSARTSLGDNKIRPWLPLTLQGLSVAAIVPAVFWPMPPLYLEIIFLCVAAVFIFLIYSHRNNLVILARVSFLGVVGYMATFIRLFYPETFFASHMRATQTLDVVMYMFLATALALTGNEIAVLLLEDRERPAVPGNPPTTLGRSFPIAALIAVIAGTLFSLQLGPQVFFHGKSFGREKILAEFNRKPPSPTIALAPQAVSHERHREPVPTEATEGKHHVDVPKGSNKRVIALGQVLDKALLFQNWNATANICLFFMLSLAYGHPGKLRRNTFILCAIYVYGFCEFLHGGRIDAVSGFFGLYVIYKMLSRQSEGVNALSVVGFGLLFIFVQLWGAFRSIPISDITAATIWADGKRLLTPRNSLGIPFYQGTVNDLMATFSGTVYLLKYHRMTYLWGHSYLDYLARTPPRFLYPARPEDLAWIFPKYGFTSGGGFYELAEAYYNFGFLGT